MEKKKTSQKSFKKAADKKAPIILRPNNKESFDLRQKLEAKAKK